MLACKELRGLERIQERGSWGKLRNDQAGAAWAILHLVIGDPLHVVQGLGDLFCDISNAITCKDVFGSS